MLPPDDDNAQNSFQHSGLNWLKTHGAECCWGLTLCVFLINSLILLWPQAPISITLTPIQAPVSLALSPLVDELETSTSGDETVTLNSHSATITAFHRKGTHSGSSSKKVLKPVNINTATYAQLQQLPNVGPKMAGKIIQYRKQVGGKFTTVQQLLEVPGIGPKKLAKMAPYCLL